MLHGETVVKLYESCSSYFYKLEKYPKISNATISELHDLVLNARSYGNIEKFPIFAYSCAFELHFRSFVINTIKKENVYSLYRITAKNTGLGIICSAQTEILIRGRNFGTIATGEIKPNANVQIFDFQKRKLRTEKISRIKTFETSDGFDIVLFGGVYIANMFIVKSGLPYGSFGAFK